MDFEKDNKSPAFQAFNIESMIFITFSSVQMFEKFGENMKLYSQIKSKEEFLKFNFDALLDPIHSIMLNASTLAGYFWPLDPSSQPRANFLKEKLTVSEKSPLANPKLHCLSNNFHHMIEDYLKGDITGEIVPRHVGPLAKPDDQVIHLFRGYDPEKNVFELLGEEFMFQPIAEEVFRIHNLILAAQKNNYKFS
ncbi:MAG: hypothetical protein ACKVIX_06325 [Sphingomonadales bacterium]|jgi:hypothetical protein